MNLKEQFNAVINEANDILRQNGSDCTFEEIASEDDGGLIYGLVKNGIPLHTLENQS